jgi:hypothetical protein
MLIVVHTDPVEAVRLYTLAAELGVMMTFLQEVMDM